MTKIMQMTFFPQFQVDGRLAFRKKERLTRQDNKTSRKDKTV